MVNDLRHSCCTSDNYKCYLLSGNQRLDFQEFVTFMSKHWHERDQEAELRDAFRLFDRDNSGYITINELKQVCLNQSM
jgi:Ca2+-binding EF-hand superfamily protein